MSHGPASGIPAKGEGHGGPARGHVWPPFEKGHTLSMRHGARSPRRVDPLAASILEAVRADVSWWRPADEPLAWRWAQAMARVELLEDYLAGLGGKAGGLLDDDGEVRAAARYLVKCESVAAGLADKLGLTPLARARLGRDVAQQQVDLARLWAQEAAQERRDGPIDGDGNPDHGDGTSGADSGADGDEDVMP